MTGVLVRKNELRRSVYLDELREKLGERAIREENSAHSRSIHILPQGAVAQYQDSIGAPPYSRMRMARRSSVVSFLSSTDLPNSPPPVLLDKAVDQRAAAQPSAAADCCTPPSGGAASMPLPISPAGGHCSRIVYHARPTSYKDESAAGCSSQISRMDDDAESCLLPNRHSQRARAFGGDPKAGSSCTRRASASEFVYTDGLYYQRPCEGGDLDSATAAGLVP